MPEHPNRIKLPDTRSGFTRKETCGAYEFYVTVSFYDQGDLSSLPGEVFIKIAKEGSVLAGMCDALATTISLALQHGVPWKVLRDKYMHTRFEPSGSNAAGIHFPSIVHAIACTVDEIIAHRTSIWGAVDDVADTASDLSVPSGGASGGVPEYSAAPSTPPSDRGHERESDVLHNGVSGQGTSSVEVGNVSEPVPDGAD